MESASKGSFILKIKNLEGTFLSNHIGANILNSESYSLEKLELVP